MNEFLVELAYRSLILAGLGLIVRFALIRSSAQARAAVLALTMISLAILPIAMALLPRLTVTVAKHEVIESAIGGSVTVSSAPPSFVFPWVLVWMSIAVFLAARVAISLYRFRKLELGFSPASDSLTERVKGLTQRACGIFFCPQGEPPMTWGLLQPKIALPTESEEWIEPQLRSVVLHEDAHIRRGDWAAMIGFRLTSAAYWFNPLVWALQKFYELDSERAADDFVLAQGVDAPEYASRLVEVAKTLRNRNTRLPAITMAKSHRLNGRVAAILNSNMKRGMLTGWTRVSVLGVLIVGLVLPEIKQIRVVARSTSESRSESNSVSTHFTPNPSPSILHEASADTSDLDSKWENEPDSIQNPEPNSIKVTLPHATKAPQTKEALVSGGKHPSKKIQSDGKDVSIDSLADMKIEVGDIDFKAVQKEIDEGMSQAKEEMEKALKDSEKDFKQAEADLDKAEMPESAKKIAKQSLTAAKGFTGNVVKGVFDSLNPKGQKDKPKLPKVPNTNENQSNDK